MRTCSPIHDKQFDAHLVRVTHASPYNNRKTKKFQYLILIFMHQQHDENWSYGRAINSFVIAQNVKI